MTEAYWNRQIWNYLQPAVPSSVTGRQRLLAAVQTQVSDPVKYAIFERLIVRRDATAAERLTASDCVVLADALKVDRLLLLTMLRRPRPEQLVAHESIDSFKAAALPDTACRYFVQNVVLENADVQILRSILPGNQVSPVHVHRSEEMLICLSGSVLLRVGESGAPILLKPGDVAHFDADSLHGTQNAHKTVDAEVLVLRFHQLRSDTSARGYFSQVARSLQTQATWDGLRDRSEVPQDLEQLLAWVTDDLRLKDAGAAGVSCMDVIGAGRFLEHERVRTGVSLRDVEAALSGKYSPKWLGRFHRGLEQADAAKVYELAKAHRVPARLLWHFESARVRNMIVLSAGVCHSFGYLPQIRPDLRKREDPTLPVGARYYMPVRHLSDSDVAAFMFELEPGANVGPNDHAGAEILIPIVGEKVSLDIDGEEPVELSAKQRAIAVFNSGILHNVINRGSQMARVFAVRFQNVPLPPKRSRTRQIRPTRSELPGGAPQAPPETVVPPSASLFDDWQPADRGDS